MVTVIGNTHAFVPVSSDKMDELLRAPKESDELACYLCKKHAEKQTQKGPICASDELLQMQDLSVKAEKEISETGPVTQPIEKAPAEAADPPKPTSPRNGGSTVNPEAPPFTPGQQFPQKVTKGLHHPEEFMAFWRAKHPSRKATITNPHRRIVFKNVPEWATISDILCLVHGGAIERVWVEENHEVNVQFVNETDCKKYHETYANGIRIDDHVIQVECTTCEAVSQKLKNIIDAGNTRVVYVDIPAMRSLQELEEVTKAFDVDHIVYHVEPNKNGRAYYFFRSIHHGHEMMRKLLEPDWNGVPANFMPDPCAEAKGFHQNGIPASRMLSAVANES